MGSKCIQLICWLDDKHLPCVPPISVIVPTDYPSVPPHSILTTHEYATPYLSAVQHGLDARLSKLPKYYSLSQLLDTWEMSVRQASASSYQNSTVISTVNTSAISNSNDASSTSITTVSLATVTNNTSVTTLANTVTNNIAMAGA